MFANDAGHTHRNTAYLIPGCPLCDQQRAVRNQAIAHLSEALHLLSRIRPTGEQPTVRLNLAPIGVTGDDVDLCRSFDLTAKLAEKLSDAIDSMNAYVGSEAPSLPFPVELDAETIAAITDVFTAIDPREMTKTVLDHRQVDMPRAIEALDDVFGEIADPYADEDDA
jgi:hypothetical protein